MALTRTLVYDVNANWEQLPVGLSHRDVADVAIDARDRVYLFTRSEHAVLVFQPDGTLVATWGQGVFTNPHGICIGPDGSIFCTDNGDHTVRQFSPDGGLRMTLGTPGVAVETGYDPTTFDPGTIVKTGPPFNSPTNVAVAAGGDLYVSDGYGNARVHHFSADGQLLHSWGEPGSGPGQFMLPHGICTTLDGRILVADRENDRIQVFSPAGAFLEAWTDIQRPCDMDTDAEGRIYVAELWRMPGQKSYTHGVAAVDQPGRISILAPDGQVLARRGGPERCAVGSFVAPHGIAVDSRGDVYVAEVTWTLAGRHGWVPPDCHQFQKFTCQPRDGAA